MNEINDSMLDEQLRGALGSPAKADFDQWRERYGEAIAHLNPVVTEIYRRRRKVLVRLASGAIAASLLVALLVWSLGPQQSSFAETVKVLTEAKSITWTTIVVSRCQSKDGKYTWLKDSQDKYAYLQPGFLRQVQYDDEGRESFITTVDVRGEKPKFLVLNMKEKKTDPQTTYETSGPMSADGPFGDIVKMLKTQPVELVGQREIQGKTVNVFRSHYEKMPVKENTVDIWIDAKTKQYVGGSQPGADFFDPGTMPERYNRHEKTIGVEQILGSITLDVDYDAKVDPSLFSMTPPADFQVVEPPTQPHVSEAQMVEWLGLMAQVNNDTFVDRPLEPFDNQPIKVAFTRVSVADMKASKVAPPPDLVKEADRDPSEVEKKLKKTFDHYRESRHHFPVYLTAPLEDFVNEETVAKSFGYVGKGVKFGTADRIVCWYKLKSTGKYRAVYGDLQVKDVKPEDLPMAVDK